MTLKLAIRHYSRYPFVNFCLILQLIIIQVMSIAMTSSIESRYKDYNTLHTLLVGDGNVYSFRNGMNPDTKIASFGSDEIQKKLFSHAIVTCSYDPWLRILDSDDQWTSEGVNAITYDDALISHFIPELDCGEWFDLSNTEISSTPVVISHNNYDLNVGDHFQYSLDNETAKDAVVIGIIKEGAKVIYPGSASRTGFQIKDLYKNYYFQIEEKMLVISAERFMNNGYHGQPSGIMIVQYPHGITEEQQISNDIFLKKIGMMTFCSSNLQDFRYHSQKYIYEQVISLLPIALSVVILSLISIICMSALLVKRQLRDYAVYSICGLAWKQCAIIQLYELFICATSSSFIVWLGLLFLKPFYQNTVITIGVWQLLISIIIALLCLIVAMMLPLQLLRKKTPKMIIQESER